MTSSSAQWLAIRDLFANSPVASRMEPYLNDDVEMVDLGVLDEYGCWSTGERQLVDVGVSLQSSEHKVSLREVLCVLSPAHLRRVLKVIETARPDLERGLS